jgi:hypothetical protein
VLLTTISDDDADLAMVLELARRARLMLDEDEREAARLEAERAAAERERRERQERERAERARLEQVGFGLGRQDSRWLQSMIIHAVRRTDESCFDNLAAPSTVPWGCAVQ